MFPPKVVNVNGFTVSFDYSKFDATVTEPTAGGYNAVANYKQFDEETDKDFYIRVVGMVKGL